MIDGIMLIDKPTGMTSFGVVARVRRVLSQDAGRKVKVGHTGTLDPFATGLMILVVGKECKNAGNYSKLDKVYEATIHLGAVSTTGDPEGEVAETSTEVYSEDLIRDTLTKFVGDVEQVPPAYSAIKINGQRAYKLARAGEEVVVPPRTVTIHSIELLEYEYPRLRVRTRVSSGTYIRTLAADIGSALGSGAYCEALRRTSISKWSVDNAQSVDEILTGKWTIS